MKRTRVTASTLAVLVALSSPLLGGRPSLAAAGTSVQAQGGEQLRESVVVSGRGEVLGEPDTVTAEFGIEAQGSTVDEAMSRATAAATKMRDALVSAGLAKADLRTSNVGVGTKQDDKGKITGYTVNQGLTATIRKIPRAGALISAAIAAGGDASRLNGVSFTIEDDTALLAAARKKAFADARVKAELYAREAGRPLGRVVKVSEEVPGFGGPVEQDHRAAYAAGSLKAVPIEPGRQRLAVTVTVEWSLGTAPA